MGKVLTKKSIITSEELRRLKSIFNRLEGETISIDYICKYYSPMIILEDFQGYIEDNELFLGSLDYTPSIKLEDIRSVNIIDLGISFNIDFVLKNKSIIKIYG